MQNNEVKCWGLNNAGQLGDGTNQNRSTPVSPIGIGTTAVSFLSSKPKASMLLLTNDNKAKFWGSDTRTPVDDPRLPTPPRKFTGQYSFDAFILNSSSGVEIRNPSSPTQFDPVTGEMSSGVIDIQTTSGVGSSGSGPYTCALAASRSVKCAEKSGWQNNTFFTDPSINNIIEFGTAFNATFCAITSSRNVKCRGTESNQSGSLGTGTTNPGSGTHDVLEE